ncbi:MAG TPA: 3-phosphoglycerate dehydrogenase [Rhodospirillaceae bacterium]|nr:3-phosphoglycerate dehydrogenase [Magnetovibrio sp.]HBT42489.1 3-phosphoglycerate dehydrogenase [Rhodospirillaceae bacterium]HCS68787.1 3-phosphoglycerate dehydrogenase [Rhodospirillaceae bacterium]|tara:strand:+ start:838 stop:1800 length:963 start_codon:yes stop_codon:yes gene_type:complete
MATIFVEGPMHARGMELLSLRDDLDVRLEQGLTPDSLAAAIKDADAVILRLTPLTAQAIAGAANLKVVSRLGVGYDHVDVAALSGRGIPLAIVGDALAASVAEHTVLLMLGLSRQIAVMDRYTRTGRYAERFKSQTHELLDKSVLIVGLGGIGGEAAKRCAAFGMRVVACGREATRKEAQRLGYDYVADFHDALGDVDFVSLHLPANDDGTPLLGAAEFAAMKPGAYVINTARGSLIDEDALHAALVSGHLGGAGLDVTKDEPPKEDCPLLALDNVLFTPHNSALTVETGRRVAETAVRNVLAGLDGNLDPAFVVNKEVL